MKIFISTILLTAIFCFTADKNLLTEKTINLGSVVCDKIDRPFKGKNLCTKRELLPRLFTLADSCAKMHGRSMTKNSALCSDTISIGIWKDEYSLLFPGEPRWVFGTGSQACLIDTISMIVTDTCVYYVKD